MGSHGPQTAGHGHARAGGRAGRTPRRGGARQCPAPVRCVVGRRPKLVMSSPRIVLVLSENWTMTPARDLRALVRIAQEAEDAGVDGVMLSEHIVMGPSAGS